MKKITLLLPSLLGALISGQVGAYELGTHAAITQQAFEKSVLADPQFQQDLGLTDGVEVFGKKYLDVSGTDIKIRDGFDFEKSFMPKGSQAYSISGWLMRGAIREDDSSTEDNPQDDRFNPDLKRPLHHFFDPYNNRPLTAFGLSVLDPDVHTAPAWGIGGRDPFVQPNVAEVGRRNHFTVFDAREALYRALTGRDSQGNELTPTGTLSKPKDIRNAYWATTFRALGDIVHLVQDMAQPQHTRNDPHAGRPFAGHTSVFEKYIEARATGASFFSIDGTKPPIQPLNYGGYPATTFNTYSDFWSTRTGITGGGLADYSNRSFFSAGTNLGGNDYLSPSNDPNNYTKESTAGLLPKPFLSLKKINFLRGGVDGTTNIRMTTEGLFDFFLFSTKPTYSLNRFNYDDMAGLLIPRAVGYSAGLINYFFRGKMDFVPDTTDPSKYVIKNLGQEVMGGKFTLYYDDKNDKRHPVPGAEWSLLIEKNKDSTPVSFTPPTSPAPKADGEYMLVFKGTLGQEANAVVGHWVEDPLVVVGQSGDQAFRQTLIKRGGVWIKGKMEGLGILPGQTSSIAHAVSKDGKVVAGQSGNQAFRWTRDEGMVGLGVLSGYGADSYSTYKSMSADGSVIVGVSGGSAKHDQSYNQAFRWTKEGGMMGLGFLPSDGDFLTGTYVTYLTPLQPLGKYVSYEQNIYGKPEGAPPDHTGFGIREQIYHIDIEIYLQRRDVTTTKVVDIFRSSAVDVSADGSKVVGVSAYSYGDSGSGSLGEPFLAYTTHRHISYLIPWNVPIADMQAWNLRKYEFIKAEEQERIAALSA